MNSKISFKEFSRQNHNEIFSINSQTLREFYAFATHLNERRIKEKKPEIEIELILQVVLYKKSEKSRTTNTIT